MGAFGLKISYRQALTFEKILVKADKATGRVQRRGGALVRTIWRRSIRYRKNKKSSPGSLPFTHVKSGSFGLRMILYDYDPATQTTIIGPVGGSENTGVPKALEFQGRTKIKLSPRDRRRLGRKYTTATIRKRPSGGPAIEKFSSEYPDLWKGSIE